MTELSCKVLRNKESLLRFKNGSPKLKDVLRKKCRDRWQKNREDFVDKLRNISQDADVVSTLTGIIKEDLKTIYTCEGGGNEKRSPNMSNYIVDEEEEILDEELEWLMSKYENIFENDDCLANMLDNLEEVMCPICQKSSLTLEDLVPSGYIALCKCGLAVPTLSDLYQIRENIMSCLDDHNNGCNLNPQFGVMNEGGENHVYLMCYGCSSFQMLL